MAILNVLTYPDPRLRRCAEAVKLVDDDTRKLIDDMAETMYTAPGIGLAAIQVDVRKRVIVDRSGSEFILEADGVLAVCIQHEIDHLNGKVFVDHLSRIKRDRIRKKLSKQERRGSETLAGSAVA